MKRIAILVAALVFLITPQVEAAGYHSRHHNSHQPPVVKQQPAPTPKPVTPVPPVVTPPAVAGNATIKLVTFYGYPDNSPAGTDIAYPGLHKTAGGTGTYADPITFATDATEFKPGTVLYIPYLSKYVVMEDSCAECESDWGNGVTHIDIWLNSNASFASQVLACEDKYTKNNVPVVTNPPSSEPVIATLLFNTSTGKCL